VAGRYLSFAGRKDIAPYNAQGLGVRVIARKVGRNPSTISREPRRNASTRSWQWDYRATIAERHAERRGRRPKTARLVANERPCAHGAGGLAGAAASRMVVKSARPVRHGRAREGRTAGTGDG
jgi:IS30 family transposase